MAADFPDQWETVFHMKLPQGLVIDGSLCKGKNYSELSSKFHHRLFARKLPTFLLSGAQGKEAEQFYGLWRQLYWKNISVCKKNHSKSGTESAPAKVTGIQLQWMILFRHPCSIIKTIA